MGFEEVVVSPDEIWEYFEKNAVKLEHAHHKCAQSDNWSVWITNDDDLPTFTVFCGEEPMREYEAINKTDAMEQYMLALSDIGIEYGDLEVTEIDESAAEEYDIQEREAELDDIISNAMSDMLGTDWLKVDEDAFKNAVSTAKEVLCDIMGKQYKLPLYRPMHLVGEDGKQFFSEYPYGSLAKGDSMKTTTE